jgi:hypothetical protein
MACDRRGRTVVCNSIAICCVNCILRGKSGLLDEERRLGTGYVGSLDNGRASKGGHVLGRRAGSRGLVAGEVVDLRLLLYEKSLELVCKARSQLATCRTGWRPRLLGEEARRWRNLPSRDSSSRP